MIISIQNLILICICKIINLSIWFCVNKNLFLFVCETQIIINVGLQICDNIANNLVIFWLRNYHLYSSMYNIILQMKVYRGNRWNYHLYSSMYNIISIVYQVEPYRWRYTGENRWNYHLYSFMYNIISIVYVWILQMKVYRGKQMKLSSIFIYI